jgi:hypothetical protein
MFGQNTEQASEAMDASRGWNSGELEGGLVEVATRILSH